MIKAPPFSTSRLTSSNLSMVTVKPPHQRRKRNNLGRELDGPVEVIWSGDWKPAQKYIKNVTLHNKSLTLLKVQLGLQHKTSKIIFLDQIHTSNEPQLLVSLWRRKVRNGSRKFERIADRLSPI